MVYPDSIILTSLINCFLLYLLKIHATVMTTVQLVKVTYGSSTIFPLNEDGALSNPIRSLTWKRLIPGLKATRLNPFVSLQTRKSKKNWCWLQTMIKEELFCLK